MGIYWSVGYACLTVIVMTLFLAVAHLYRMVTLKSSDTTRSPAWPFTLLEPGQSLADYLPDKVFHTYTGFVLFSSAEVDSLAAITSLQILCHHWRSTFLIIVREGAPVPTWDLVDMDARARVFYLAPTAFAGLGATSLPAIVFLRDGRVVDASGGWSVHTPSGVERAFHLIMLQTPEMSWDMSTAPHDLARAPGENA
jgi:hypothetical protein